MEDEGGRRQWGAPAILLAFVLGVAAGYGGGLWMHRDTVEAEAKERFYEFVYAVDRLGAIDHERLDELVGEKEKMR